MSWPDLLGGEGEEGTFHNGSRLLLGLCTGAFEALGRTSVLNKLRSHCGDFEQRRDPIDTSFKRIALPAYSAGLNPGPSLCGRIAGHSASVSSL